MAQVKVGGVGNGRAEGSAQFITWKQIPMLPYTKLSEYIDHLPRKGLCFLHIVAWGGASLANENKLRGRGNAQLNK